MDKRYVIARDRSLNDHDANMSEKDRAKLRARLGEQWWDKQPRQAYSIMAASPMSKKVRPENF